MPRLYVLCHDDASQRRAEAAWAGASWASVLRLDNRPPLAVLREGAAYLGALRDREDEWADADYVGAVSWKAGDKVGLTPGGVEAACERARGADVVALYPFDAPLVEHSSACHPRFREAWVGCLRAMGYAEADATSPRMPYFVCNYWLARPAWLRTYCGWLERLAGVMRDEPGVQDALWADACYPTGLPRGRLLELYGRPYLPHHAFLAERAPCFYFWRHGARVARPDGAPLTDGDGAPLTDGDGAPLTDGDGALLTDGDGGSRGPEQA